jgi:hypothetical protein
MGFGGVWRCGIGDISIPICKPWHRSCTSSFGSSTASASQPSSYQAYYQPPIPAGFLPCNTSPHVAEEGRLGDPNNIHRLPKPEGFAPSSVSPHSSPNSQQTHSPGQADQETTVAAPVQLFCHVGILVAPSRSRRYYLTRTLGSSQALSSYTNPHPHRLQRELPTRLGNEERCR